ncbi:MAG: chemotaxis protein CheC [Candidatus Omnitrophica bacterium]|nr:chemotaxis protein CheC [Candidatus Omnitrophota bacterium]
MGENKEELSFEGEDILREVGNICVGNSTGILSQLLGGVVRVNPPSLDILSMSTSGLYKREREACLWGKCSSKFPSARHYFSAFPRKTRS